MVRLSSPRKVVARIAQNSCTAAHPLDVRRARLSKHYKGGNRLEPESAMDYRKKFAVEPGTKVRLSKIDTSFTGKHGSHDKATQAIQRHVERMAELQYL